MLVPEASGVAGLQAGLKQLMGDRELATKCVLESRRGLPRFEAELVAVRQARAYRAMLERIAPRGAIAS